MKLIEVTHVPIPDLHNEEMQQAANKIIKEFDQSNFKRAKIEFYSDDIVPANRHFKNAVRGTCICVHQRIDGIYLIKRT